ncbi:hypothetical protein CANARDRAFT_26320 [[Candida] arabinofermentans NRRL YB-2248]|uniref:DNA 3'-5' helicase n=1 Tax=[Candida] arabinofermentans NRRL YB-2248 TaxID=983967 RepID=A0A1E4T8U4_9ASCO|nr:hypothetical protein CANARDRAFT_26320 [[Candida] arabinofermentans NRRL YB-2248]
MEQGQAETSEAQISIDCTDLQYDAITSDGYTKPDTLLNIVAGPGSGKTRTLCNRIAYMLSCDSPGDIKPEEILVLSMTNRSVNDLKYKLKEVLGIEELVSSLQVMTFHSFAGGIINTKFDNWQIIEDEEIKRLSELVPNMKKNSASSVKTLKEIFQKSKFIDVDQYESSELYKVYNFDKASFLKLRELIGGSYSLFTYDDILVECNRILDEDPPEFMQKYKAIIIDEFQDVYPSLADMIVKVSKGKHLTIAGDPNQSIYGFLGARVTRNWGKVLPMYEDEDVRSITLGHSFRSTPELLAISSQLIGKKLTNIHTSVKSSNLLAPVRMSFNSQDQEYEFIYNESKKLVDLSHGQIKPSDIAILSYSNREVDSIYEYFKKKGEFNLNRLNSTPRWLKTQLSFILQYIKILIDPNQNLPLLSSLSLLRGVGLSSLNSIYTNAIKKDLSMWEYLTDPQIKKPSAIEKNTKEFLQHLDHARSTINSNDPNSIILTLLEMGSKFGLKKRIHNNKLSPLQIREYENYLHSIYKSLSRTLQVKPTDQTLLKYYLNNYNSDLLLNSNTAITKIYQDDEINFSTIHTSKGLEFPVVFILSANNYNLSTDYERKKVMYVAMTRASSLLYFNKLDDQFVTSIDDSHLPTSRFAGSIAPQPQRLTDVSNSSFGGNTKAMFDTKPPNFLKFPNLLRLLNDMGRDGSFISKQHHHFLKQVGTAETFARKLSHR